MTPTPPLPPMLVPSLGSTLVFVAICLGVLACFVLAFHQAWRGSPHRARVTSVAAGGLIVWMLTCAVLAETGVIAKLAGSPKLMIYMVVSNGLAMWVAVSRWGARLVQYLPVAWLVGFQAFRLPLELVLHSWYEQGTLPVQMTFAGANLDIVTGFAALGCWALMTFTAWGRNARWALALTFNVLGSGLLLNVVSIAVMSAPWPMRSYINDPPVLLLFHAPYTWILPVCVAAALVGHVLVFRWLVAERRSVAVSGAASKR